MLIIFLNVEITLKSLLMHNENLSVFILHTGDISESWQNDLQLYFAKRYSTLQLVHMISINTLDISPVIFHFTGPHKPLDNIFSENTYVNAVISLFRLYASISWQDIYSLPLGTIRANWINQER
ncbi:hypothetical protein [Haemophilus influenzae]|uniref:hypothetical protein n=1 Tax=Haemophilus influenzae TaxID=727 RepID=UPI001EF844BA|nr:hypothetical protein [Haemophilus influenzae]